MRAAAECRLEKCRNDARRAGRGGEAGGCSHAVPLIPIRAPMVLTLAPVAMTSFSYVIVSPDAVVSVLAVTSAAVTLVLVR